MPVVDVAQDFDLLNLDDRYFSDPYPFFSALRECDPVHRNSDGTVLLTRYEDMNTVWMDLTASVDKSETFRRVFGEGPLLEHWTHTMLFRDPPEHAVLRGLVEPFFSRRNTARLRDFIENMVDELIDQSLDKGEIDFVSEFAFQVPMRLICRILGVPQEDKLKLHDWGMQTMFCINPGVSQSDIQAGHIAAGEFSDYLRDQLNERRSRTKLDPEADILSALAQAERDGANVSELDLIHICIIILNGGHETTVNTMSVGLHALLNQPEQLAIYRNEDVARTAPDELIRFVTPIQLQGRRLTQDLQVPSGDTLANRTEIVLCPASANRDPAIFHDPDAIDLRRRPNRHLSFGGGLHLCLGRVLARMELEIALPKIARSFANIEQVGAVQFNRNARFRGLRSLPLRVRSM